MAVRIFPRGVPVAKRLFDLVLIVPGLILISPLIGAVALLLWVTEGTPVLFHQARPGLKGRIFTVYKFRTMRVERVDEGGNLTPDAERISSLGRFLRRTSLDELPELVNVLRGEMSLVGPRPLLVSYLERYNPEQARRHDVLPGISGWAQVNGRNVISWEDKFRFDVWYVDNWSLWLDVKILWMTLWKVLRREGISPTDGEIAGEFMGSKESKDKEEI